MLNNIKKYINEELQKFIDEDINKGSFVVWHYTKNNPESDEFSLKNELFVPGSGDFYGRGLYASYTWKNLKEYRMFKYGRYLIEFKIDNTGKFIIMDYDEAKRIYGNENYDLISQMKRVLGGDFNKVYNKYKDIFDQGNEELINTPKSSLILKKIYKYLISYVDGFFYNGNVDGRACVIYNLGIIHPQRYSEDHGKTWKNLSSKNYYNKLKTYKREQQIINQLENDHIVINNDNKEIILKYTPKLKIVFDLIDGKIPYKPIYDNIISYYFKKNVISLKYIKDKINNIPDDDINKDTQIFKVLKNFPYYFVKKLIKTTPKLKELETKNITKLVSLFPQFKFKYQLSKHLKLLKEIPFNTIFKIFKIDDIKDSLKIINNNPTYLSYIDSDSLNKLSISYIIFTLRYAPLLYMKLNDNNKKKLPLKIYNILILRNVKVVDYIPKEILKNLNLKDNVFNILNYNIKYIKILKDQIYKLPEEDITYLIKNNNSPIVIKYLNDKQIKEIEKDREIFNFIAKKYPKYVNYFNNIDEFVYLNPKSLKYLNDDKNKKLSLETFYQLLLNDITLVDYIPKEILKNKNLKGNIIFIILKYNIKYIKILKDQIYKLSEVYIMYLIKDYKSPIVIKYLNDEQIKEIEKSRKDFNFIAKKYPNYINYFTNLDLFLSINPKSIKYLNDDKKKKLSKYEIYNILKNYPEGIKYFNNNELYKLSRTQINDIITKHPELKKYLSKYKSIYNRSKKYVKNKLNLKEIINEEYNNIIYA